MLNFKMTVLPIAAILLVCSFRRIAPVKADKQLGKSDSLILRECHYNNPSKRMEQKRQMKRWTQFCFTTIFLLSGPHSFGQTTDWEKMKLKGKVKSLSEIEYKTAQISGKVQKQYKGLWTTYLFNEKGYLIEKKDFEPHDGSAGRRLIYKEPA